MNTKSQRCYGRGYHDGRKDQLKKDITIGGGLYLLSVGAKTIYHNPKVHNAVEPVLNKTYENARKAERLIKQRFSLVKDPKNDLE